MCIRIIGFQHAFIIRFGALGKPDVAVAFTHLKTDAVALFLVASAFFIGFFIAVNGFGILLASEGEIGILGGIAALGVQFNVRHHEQQGQKNQYVFFHCVVVVDVKTHKAAFYFDGINRQKYKYCLNVLR